MKNSTKNKIFLSRKREIASTDDYIGLAMTTFVVAVNHQIITSPNHQIGNYGL